VQDEQFLEFSKILSKFLECFIIFKPSAKKGPVVTSATRSVSRKMVLGGSVHFTILVLIQSKRFRRLRQSLRQNFELMFSIHLISNYSSKWCLTSRIWNNKSKYPFPMSKIPKRVSFNFFNFLDWNKMQEVKNESIQHNFPSSKSFFQNKNLTRRGMGVSNLKPVLHFKNFKRRKSLRFLGTAKNLSRDRRNDQHSGMSIGKILLTNNFWDSRPLWMWLIWISKISFAFWFWLLQQRNFCRKKGWMKEIQEKMPETSQSHFSTAVIPEKDTRKSISPYVSGIF